MTDNSSSILFSLLEECKQFLERQFGQDLVLPIYQWIVPRPKNRVQLIEWVDRSVDDPSSIADPIGFWDTSGVTDFTRVFYSMRNPNMKDFDEELNWDLSNATSTRNMFWGCEAFQGRGLKKWVVSGVTDMHGTFCHCKSFNGDLSKWGVSGVTDMSWMFYECAVFDEDLADWDVSSVTHMRYMFYKCLALDTDLSLWNVHRCNSVNKMFYNCRSFNRDCISQWVLPDEAFCVEDMF